MSSTPVLHDQAFPDRSVRIIDPFGAGGGVDVIARALARRLAAAWGQPAIVENHPGEWLTQHDADPLRMSPAEFGAFVMSEAERAAPVPAWAAGMPSVRSPPAADTAAATMSLRTTAPPFLQSGHLTTLRTDHPVSPVTFCVRPAIF